MQTQGHFKEIFCTLDWLFGVNGRRYTLIDVEACPKTIPKP